MDSPSIEQIMKNGANACALGLSFLDNPFYKSVNLPAVTGETAADWGAKAEAWNSGYEIERAMITRS